MSEGKPLVLDDIGPAAAARYPVSSNSNTGEASVTGEDDQGDVEDILRNETVDMGCTRQRKRSSEHERVSKLQRGNDGDEVLRLMKENDEEDVQDEEWDALAASDERNQLTQVEKTTDRTLPALIRLAGKDFANYETDTLIGKILESIEEVIVRSPGLTVRGRTEDGFRISYNTKDERHNYIRSKMHTLLASRLDYTALDALLSPLLATNPKAFNIEAKQFNNTRRLNNNEWSAGFFRKKDEVRHLRPFTWHNRQAIVKGLLESARKRFENNYPQSNLLRNPTSILDVVDEQEAERIRSWSLYDSSIGLAVKVQECFSDPHRSSGEYEDFVERTMHWFKITNPLPHAGRTLEYTVNKRNEYAYPRDEDSVAHTLSESYGVSGEGLEGSQGVTEKNMWELY